MYDTLIIGAGFSGLAAGIRLAYYEQRVCILERHYTIGGLNSFYRLRGRDYDVGLHAVTNYAPKGDKKGPLAKLLRQLRLAWDDFGLAPQLGSAIVFPGVRLDFNNDIRLLESEIARAFPRQKENFQRLLGQILDYDDLSQDVFDLSARQILSRTLSDPLLVEMLLCPAMWYGNSREQDMDWGQFCILFRSIFLEGMGRPYAGIRLILKNLVRKFRALGGELKLRSGVRRIVVEGGRATAVVLDSGEELSCRRILSSAGAVETMRLCDKFGEDSRAQPGRLSFVESLSILDRPPQSLGCGQTVVFFNDSEKFHWQRPEGELCDARTGVICSPNNFAYSDGEGLLADNLLRITALANFDGWQGMSEDEYRLAKLRWYDRLAASAVRFIPDFRSRVIDTDMFTPTTIRRFTGHENGAIYGATHKQLDGTTSVRDLFLCGTDQGYLGIVGALISGVAMANRHCLLPAP
ncbi:MAG TPA: NAD(P)/FAD-dependent oxidoreductase [Pirellulaceae bacterium]|nr:NAD(P)/FAD-dependent oxidoreductase [Pirellulaceae bacterium]